jgi:predicted RNA-binding Zn-ribbon protein involved in translation (DUF1610 family)
MNDYINRQALLSKKVFCEAEDEHIVYMDDVLDAPAADVQEVKHGHWIKPTGMMPPEHHGHYECSECHAWAMRDWKHRLELTEFCPNCGAKMDGDK